MTKNELVEKLQSSDKWISHAVVRLHTDSKFLPDDKNWFTSIVARGIIHKSLDENLVATVRHILLSRYVDILYDIILESE